MEQQEAFVRGVVENYDRVSIDPIMLALPESDRAALMADLPDGLDGRKQLVTAALARLEQVWRADERRKLPAGVVARTAAPGPRPLPRSPGRSRRGRCAEDDADEPELTIGRSGAARRRRP